MPDQNDTPTPAPGLAWGTTDTPAEAPPAAPAAPKKSHKATGRPPGRPPNTARPVAPAANVGRPTSADKAEIEATAADLANVAFAGLSTAAVLLCQMRGMHPEAAALAALREEQVEPIRPAAARMIRKRLGPVSDEAFVGLGLIMAFVGNYSQAAARNA